MRTLLGLVPPAVLLLAWWVGATQPGFPVLSLSTPPEVGLALWVALRDGELVRQTGETFQTAIAGLAVAALLGVPLGFVAGLAPRADRVSAGLMEMLRPIPSVAFIPLALLSFGFGPLMETSVVAFAACWPLIVVARSSAGNIDPRLLEVSRGLGFGLLSRCVKFMLPAALRQLFVGFRLSLGVALVVAVTVEVAANPRGLGYGLVSAQVALRPDLVIATLVWIGVVGWVVSAGVALLEHALFRWDAVEGAG